MIMLGFSRLFFVACSASIALGAAVSVDSTFQYPRPVLTVPTLTQIRSILAQLEAPIISTLTERLNLVTDSSLYANNGAKLQAYILPREVAASFTGRFDYGKLEYPFVLPQVAPDVTTSSNTFPPGRFHQDTFSGNDNLTSFYINTLVPLFSSSTSFFYHLDNSTTNDDAALNLDATLLGLLSHRAHIGKTVAESKYAANVTGYTTLIQAGDSDSIRTLLTNTTQEASVLTQAADAANAFSAAWVNAGASEGSSFISNLQSAATTLFRELIDITTEIEIQYLLSRFD